MNSFICLGDPNYHVRNYLFCFVLPGRMLSAKCDFKSCNLINQFRVMLFFLPYFYVLASILCLPLSWVFFYIAFIVNHLISLLKINQWIYFFNQWIKNKST